MPQSEVPLPPQAPVPDKREIVRLLSNEANQQELFRRADAVRKEKTNKPKPSVSKMSEMKYICAG